MFTISPLPASIINGAAWREAYAVARKPPPNIRSQCRHSIVQKGSAGSGDSS